MLVCPLVCRSSKIAHNVLAVAAVPLSGRDIYVKIKKQANQETFLPLKDVCLFFHYFTGSNLRRKVNAALLQTTVNAQDFRASSHQ